MKKLLRRLIPASLINQYHRAWALGSARYYGHPSRSLTVIAVTGTKGKSTTTELIARLLRECGLKAASASTIRFCIGDDCRRNLFKMTMPGRSFVQRFLRDAVSAGCTHAVVEMTSEGARQYRHAGIELDALVFTNLAPEHIESHGSFEAYLAAKLSLAQAVSRSPKRPRILVANADDEHGARFLEGAAEIKAAYSLTDAEPYTADDRSVRFVWRGEVVTVPLPGLFNLYNCLAALTLGETLGLEHAAMRRALEHVPPIAGRAERIECGQSFGVVVDYAHTMESLRALYETYKGHRLIAVIGATGGGRDAQKRAARGALAEEYADSIIITNEDPYDEDPLTIMRELASGLRQKKPLLIPDRRAAIAAALKDASGDDVVLLTGKGTDPYIMGPRGSKEEWSDAKVAAEELAKLGYH